MKNRNRLKIWIANMICSVIFWLHGFHTFPKLADNGPTISVASSVLQSSDNYFQEISSIFLSVTMEKRAEGKMLINCLVGWFWLVGWFGWLVGWIWLLGWLVGWFVGWFKGFLGFFICNVNENNQILQNEKEILFGMLNMRAYSAKLDPIRLNSIQLGSLLSLNTL